MTKIDKSICLNSHTDILELYLFYAVFTKPPIFPIHRISTKIAATTLYSAQKQTFYLFPASVEKITELTAKRKTSLLYKMKLFYLKRSSVFRCKKAV